jgi:hypothetical protein
MITTLDAQPQEWMEGDETVFHTVAACHFENLEHIEHWIHKLIPRNQNGDFVKWSGGRRKAKTRDQFVDNCLKYSSEIDFQVNCISTSEGEMSWFAWAFYMQNQRHVTQRLDAKSRNCLVFQITTEKDLHFPVLRAGYLIWYHHVIRYLAESQNIKGKLISDNFACDQEPPGDGTALGVSFVNFLLTQSKSDLQVSLPRTDRYRACDRLSDYFCGWVNSVRSKTATESHERKLAELEAHPKKFIENVIFAMNLNIVDDQGNDVTEAVKSAVASESANSGIQPTRKKPRAAHAER